MSKLFIRLIVLFAVLTVLPTGTSLSNERMVKFLTGEPAHPFSKIDILYVRLVDSALSSLREKGFKLDGYDAVLISKANSNYYTVTFSNHKQGINQSDGDSPSWEVTIHGDTFAVADGRHPW